MADKRKLQGEIDRCIKKVTEGVAFFEDVWQKVQTAPSLNQKEKFEADLKKEIKKLQRLRDQIKTWLASNDIKDKRQLTENRKIIEAQMERFKVVERETKTKAYSKEGLGAATKVDPKEKEKEDAKEWVTQCIDSLQLQKDQFESEIEGIDNKKKGNRVEKDRQERIDELKNLLVQHEEHIDCLELVLRGVDNDQIDLEQLKKIRDSIEYYVESHDSDSGDLSIYDDLHLDVLRQSSNAVGLTSLANDDDCLSNSSDPPLINPSSPSPGITNHSKDKPHEEEKKHNSKSTSHADDKGNQHSSKANTAGLQLNCVPIPITPTKRDSVSSSLESTTPDAVLRTPPPVAYAQAVSGNQQNSRTSSTSSQPSSGSAGNSRPASQSAWTATESKLSEHGSSSAVPVTPTTVIAGTPLAASAPPSSNGTSSAVNGVINGSVDAPPVAPAALTGASTSALPPPHSAAAGALLPVDTSSAVASPPLSTAFPGHSTSSLYPTQSASDSKVVLNGPLSAISSLGKLQGHPDLSSLTAKLLTASQQQQQDPTAPASLSALASTVFDSLPPNSLTSSDLSLLMQQQGQGQGQQLQPYMLHQQGQGLPQQQQGQGQGSAGSQQQQMPLQTTTIHLSPLLGVAPLGTQPLTKEQLYQMALLDTANMHLPYPSDSERLRYYLPRNPCPSPPYYPQAAPAHSDAVEFYQKLSVETLFFIFYYMEGTKAQYLAAKALKKQSWRFHTKYMMWFQRHEEPKMITEDYEQGTYVYFDYEKWCQRKKEGFMFEYRFLEDRDLN